MMSSQIYILVSILVLLVVGIILFFFKKEGGRRMGPLGGLAFGFILAGIIFRESSLIGYGLIGVGVVLAVVDIVLKLKK